METSVAELIKDKTVKEASVKINELKKEIESQKDLRIAILEDYIKDNKETRRFQRVVIVCLLVAVFVAIASFVGMHIYANYQITSLSKYFVIYLDKVTPEVPNLLSI